MGTLAIYRLGPSVDYPRAWDRAPMRDKSTDRAEVWTAAASGGAAGSWCRRRKEGKNRCKSQDVVQPWIGSADVERRIAGPHFGCVWSIPGQTLSMLDQLRGRSWAKLGQFGSKSGAKAKFGQNSAQRGSKSAPAWSLRAKFDDSGSSLCPEVSPKSTGLGPQVRPGAGRNLDRIDPMLPLRN